MCLRLVGELRERRSRRRSGRRCRRPGTSRAPTANSGEQQHAEPEVGHRVRRHRERRHAVVGASCVFASAAAMPSSTPKTVDSSVEMPTSAIVGPRLAPISAADRLVVGVRAPEVQRARSAPGSATNCSPVDPSRPNCFVSSSRWCSLRLRPRNRFATGSPSTTRKLAPGSRAWRAARALSDHFEQVVVLERESLSDGFGAPAGHAAVPACPRAAGGGERALSALFPGFERDLVEAGAVLVRANIDFRAERPGYDPFPQRDLGLINYALSRPAIEYAVRRRLRSCANVSLRDRCRVGQLLASADGTAVTGVRFEEEVGGSRRSPLPG